MTDTELDEAFSGLAYNFVMLGEAIRRVNVLLGGYEEKSSTPEIRSEIVELPDGGSAFGDRPVYSTASEPFVSRVEHYVRPEGMPVEIPQPSLTEYRSYVEWTLILARRLSDVVSSKKMRKTDVAASDLLDDPQFRLDALPKPILDRIDKAVAHQTYFSHGPEWDIPEIDEWRKRIFDELVGHLRLRQFERALVFEAYVGQYQKEIDEYG